MDNCIFCGSELGEKTLCEQHNLKRMCINCVFLDKDDDGLCFCTNGTNMEKAKMATIAEVKNLGNKFGYDVEFDIKSLKPLPLKKPLSRCAQWSLGLTIEEMEKLFV